MNAEDKNKEMDINEVAMAIANHFLHIIFYPLNPCPKALSSLNDMPK